MTNSTIRLEPDSVERIRGAEKRAFVVVLSGDRMGEMFPLKDDRTTIGRGLQTDVRINDEGISRTHAVVEMENGDYLLSDAGSTNGTFANGNKVDRYKLQEGDKIQIGASSVLKFTYHDDLDEDFQRTLYESALRDRLTGIFNRGYFSNRLESDVAFALRHGKPLSLVIFDVDDFKPINDEHGHPVGDQVLSALAHRVLGTTRSEDIFARYGGEEFALICRDVDAMRAAKAAIRIKETVADKPFDVGGRSLAVTVSVGVADLSQLVEPKAEALVEAADAALYVAKRGGKNRVEVYDPENEPTRLV
ncbi:GGDEF domain-containing protein [Paraliomyxa miuraensis]|uniref:GGDEF domain-containing protein n=1 Tax=Paraliomyxa miuraensis TaxID=376150 RepID=UPI0022529890|nr:GGDEF domain-containing protein [Paraliomyxa miuraensis]MCX4244831.1 diguanylate cyclase [Paraliomyxa miuraensis]